MTGMEAWHLISPLLARFIEHDDLLIKAYVTVFCALNEYDKGERKDEE